MVSRRGEENWISRSGNFTESSGKWEWSFPNACRGNKRLPDSLVSVGQYEELIKEFKGKEEIEPRLASMFVK